MKCSTNYDTIKQKDKNKFQRRECVIVIVIKEKQDIGNNAQLMFDQIRSEVLSIIEKNKTKEITNDTDVYKAGVYMLYVDSFDDETIIPFYIGQTSDFQERHKQHFSEIMALNRFDRECYKYAMFADLYNGHARSCKIFSYMINHGCSLKDLHMIVLNEIEDEKIRLEIEQKYIDDLYSPFFGFNQLNTVLRFIDYRYGKINKNEYRIVKEQDVNRLLHFNTFGYGEYNWYRTCESFYNILTSINRTNEIPTFYLKILESKKRLEKIKWLQRNIKHYIFCQSKDEVWELCKDTINTYFSQRNLKSEDKKKLVVKVMLDNCETDRNQLEKYFARYSTSDEDDLLESINRIYAEKIQKIKQRIINKKSKYDALDDEKEILNNVVFGTLLPKQYVSHPLGDIEKSINFKVCPCEENVCYLNIEFTCFKSDYYHDFYPKVSKIDYCIVKNGKNTVKSIYITNSLADFFSRDDLYYYEKGFNCIFSIFNDTVINF